MKGIDNNTYGSNECNKISPECANSVFEICAENDILLDDSSLDLSLSRENVMEVLDSNIPSSCREEYRDNRMTIMDTLMRSRYVNLYYLLRVSCGVLIPKCSVQIFYLKVTALFQDHLSEESYIAIVRNQILVDVQVCLYVVLIDILFFKQTDEISQRLCIVLFQGEDLLFQIFTSNILQRNPGDEAPFFEFIQRVCSECSGPDGCPKQLKPGCGGFG